MADALLISKQQPYFYEPDDYFLVKYVKFYWYGFWYFVKYLVLTVVIIGSVVGFALCFGPKCTSVLFALSLVVFGVWYVVFDYWWRPVSII